MQYPINILKKNDIKVAKVIRVIGPYWNLFTGYIVYSRPFKETYNSDTNDLLDLEILNGIKIQFPDSKLILNKDIVFQGELENIKKVYSSGHAIDFTINFLPSVSFEMLDNLQQKKLYGYSKKFTMHLMLNSNNEKINDIRRFSISYVSYEQYKEFENLLNSLNC